MPVNVFVSFDHDDAAQVGGFRSLVTNDNHPLDFNDHSLHEAVVGRDGRPIKYPPTDSRAEPVRIAIRKQFEHASRLVVLIGDNTHQSAWVDWEIREFYRMKSAIPGASAAKRIRGMRLKGRDTAKAPDALEGRSSGVMRWDAEALDRWFDEPLV